MHRGEGGGAKKTRSHEWLIRNAGKKRKGGGQKRQERNAVRVGWNKKAGQIEFGKSARSVPFQLKKENKKIG